jgi:hypothetical protein
MTQTGGRAGVLEHAGATHGVGPAQPPSAGTPPPCRRRGECVSGRLVEAGTSATIRHAQGVDSAPATCRSTFAPLALSCNPLMYAGRETRVW